jgi:hypothetical protein
MWPTTLARHPLLRVALGASLLLALTGAGTPSSAAHQTPRQTVANRACGWRPSPPARYDHVVWVLMENHSHSQLIGRRGSAVARRSPYLNSLARRCGEARRYYAVTHPSLPNYLALASGSTGGVHPPCTPATCPQRRPTVFDQLTAAGRDWRVYAEGMPRPCHRTDSGRYVVRHNPPTYFPVADCAGNDLPMGTTARGRLVDDLAGNRLAALTVVVPDQCHNTHDCPIGVGDRWLSRLVPRILASPAYRAGSTALVVTWDEGAGGTAGQDCRARQDASCHLATVVASPATRPGTRARARFDHYSLLEATARMLGLPPLGHAADRRTRDLRSAFRL